jgi:predicted metal-dependent hydrolase
MQSEKITTFGTITCNEREIPYTVIYSDRSRTWGIEVRPDLSINIRVPRNIPPGSVRKLVETKRDWIVRQVQKYSSRPRITRNYTDGETLPLLGQEYLIVRKTGNLAKAEFVNDLFFITIPNNFTETDQATMAHDLIIMLYQEIGTIHLKDIIQHYAFLAGTVPSKYRITHQKRKWGSCTPKNEIIINTRVLLAPRIVAEYIVVHELTHLKFCHHQKTFWNEVERLMPEYRDAGKNSQK